MSKRIGSRVRGGYQSGLRGGFQSGPRGGKALRAGQETQSLIAKSPKKTLYQKFKLAYDKRKARLEAKRNEVEKKRLEKIMQDEEFRAQGAFF